GSLGLEFHRAGKPGFHHVRQFQVLEEVIQEFFAAELEYEIVFGGLIAIAGTAFARAAARRWTLYFIAFLVFGIAGIDRFPHAAMRMAESRLFDILGGNGYFLTAGDIDNGTALDSLGNGFLDLRFVTPEEALTIDGRLILALQATINKISQYGLPSVQLKQDCQPAARAPAGATLLRRLPDPQVPFAKQAHLFCGIAFFHHTINKLLVLVGFVCAGFCVE